MSRAPRRWAFLLLLQEGRQWEPDRTGPAVLGVHRGTRQQRHPRRTMLWRIVWVTRADCRHKRMRTAMWRSSTHRATLQHSSCWDVRMMGRTGSTPPYVE